jgi:integrase
VPSPLAYKWLREHWVRARKAAGAGDVRLHDLRHFTAQLLVNAGRPEAAVQGTLRHATPAMTRRHAMMRDGARTPGRWQRWSWRREAEGAAPQFVHCDPTRGTRVLLSR